MSEQSTNDTERCPTCGTVAEDAGGRFKEHAVCPSDDCYRSYFIRRSIPNTIQSE